jgi:hypothetical protein
MARFINKTATIRAGQSLSDVIECDTGAPTFIHMPSQWTRALLSFQVSSDGINFNDLFDGNGREIVFNIPAGVSINIPIGWDAVLHLKLRSGPRDHQVAQEADRAIVVTIDTATPR